MSMLYFVTCSAPGECVQGTASINPVADKGVCSSSEFPEFSEFCEFLITVAQEMQGFPN